MPEESASSSEVVGFADPNSGAALTTVCLLATSIVVVRTTCFDLRAVLALQIGSALLHVPQDSCVVVGPELTSKEGATVAATVISGVARTTTWVRDTLFTVAEGSGFVAAF